MDQSSLTGLVSCLLISVKSPFSAFSSDPSNEAGSSARMGPANRIATSQNTASLAFRRPTVPSSPVQHFARAPELSVPRYFRVIRIFTKPAPSPFDSVHAIDYRPQVRLISEIFLSIAALYSPVATWYFVSSTPVRMLSTALAG